MRRICHQTLRVDHSSSFLVDIQGLHSKIWYCQIHGHYAVYKKCRVFPTESPPSPLRSSPNRISDSLERSKALLDGFPI